MVQSAEVSNFLFALVNYIGVLFGIIFVILLYAAYEVNRRLHLISKVSHPETWKLFNQLRFLFLFISLHFCANLIFVAFEDRPSVLCLILAIMHLVSYIGIGLTSATVALSRILVLGRLGDNKDNPY
jgi:hypothetical protein